MPVACEEQAGEAGHCPQAEHHKRYNGDLKEGVVPEQVGKG
jgi:hypothetical protein